LVQRAQKGDSAAFGTLFRVHVQRVNRIVRRLAGPRSDSDDLVQTVFIEVFRSLPAFRGEALFSTWLAKIAVRVAMRALKRPFFKTVPLEQAGDPRSQEPSPERTAGDRERLQHLDRLLADLKPKRRIAWVLHVLEGYSMEEMSAMLSVSVTALKARVHDARKDVERSLRREPWLCDERDDGDAP
jgi:RNA polymerase sigma-70 factor (ECF subfamily)